MNRIKIHFVLVEDKVDGSGTLALISRKVVYTATAFFPTQEVKKEARTKIKECIFTINHSRIKKACILLPNHLVLRITNA